MQVPRWPPRNGPIRSRVAAAVGEGRIVDLASVPGGAAALVSSRVNGAGWDIAPRVLVYRSGKATTLRLPGTTGDVLVRAISASWPTLTVHGANFDRNGAIVPLVWRSPDGGRRWTLR
jgi:hypothetical protein